MKIGFLQDNSKAPKNRIRGTELFPILKSFDIDAEECVPFYEYSHIVCKESAINPNSIETLNRFREDGTKIVLDWSDVIYNEKQVKSLIAFAKTCDKVVVSTPEHEAFLKKQKIVPVLIPDGVAYQSGTVTPRKELNRLVWYGCHDSTLGGMQDLLALNSFFRAVKGHLTIISNNVEEYTKLSKKLEIPTSYVPYDAVDFHWELVKHDVAIIPFPNASFVNYKSNNRLLEAFIREMPVICGGSAQNNQAFLNVKNKSAIDVECYYTVNGPSEYLDTLEFIQEYPDLIRQFCKEARKYVLKNDLIQNQGHLWAEIFFSG